MSRQLNERAARREFKSSQDSVEFIKKEASARGWQVLGESLILPAITRAEMEKPQGGGAFHADVQRIANVARDGTVYDARTFLAENGPHAGTVQAALEPPAEIRPQQGIWMSPSLREQAEKSAGDKQDKLAKIGALTAVQHAGNDAIPRVALLREEFRKLNAEQHASSKGFSDELIYNYAIHKSKSVVVTFSQSMGPASG